LILAVSIQLALVSASAGSASATTRLRRGDVVRDHGVGVVVPGRGRRVVVEQWLRSGGTQVLKITTGMDGIVRVRSRGSEAEEASGGPGSEGTGCDDGSHSLNRHRWVLPYKWFFRKTSTPSSLNTLAVEANVLAAIRNITAEQSPCTEGDQVGAENLYLGAAAAASDMTSDGSLCAAFGQRDGFNVVDFGELPENVLGMSCTWSTLRLDAAPVVALESDIRLNKHDASWFTTLTSNCANEYSVEGVMTHEFGHTFGLGHVSEEDHGAQTMSTHINGPCQRSETSLGLGDALGLRAMY
jgi:hypothetical protein